MKRFLRNLFAAGFSLTTVLAMAQAPTFSSAAATTTTNIRVTFGGTGGNLTLADFNGFTITGATVTAATIVGGAGNSKQVDLTVNTIASNFNCAACVAVAAAAVTDGVTANASIPAAGNNVTDAIAPVVVSSNRLTPAGSLTNVTSVIFQVTFSEPVTGVAAADFSANVTNMTAGAIVTVTGAGPYDVTVPTLSASAPNGTLRLDILNTATITDNAAAPNAYASNFTTGQTYTVDHTPPTIASAAYTPSTGTAKIGDNILVTTAAGAAETGLLVGAGSTINLISVTGTFADIGSGNYTYTYAVAGGHTDRTAGNVPLSVILADAAGNPSTAFTAVTANTLAVDATAPANENTIFPTSRAHTGGSNVALVAGTATDFNWLAPSGTTTFVANGTTITSAAGDATTIVAPTTDGDYKLFVLDPAGNYSAASTATLKVATQASAITFTAPGANTQLAFTWIDGSAGNRLVLVKTAGAVFTPVEGTNYVANTAFGSGADLNGGAGGTVKSVYNGNGAWTGTVTGLTANTAYTVEVYEYSTGNHYLQTSGTITAPATANRSTPNNTNPGASSAITFASITGTGMTVSWTGGNGTSSVLVANAGSAPTFVPVDGVSYTGISLNYTTAVDQTGGRILGIFADPQGARIVTGLLEDTQYFFTVYDMNGTAGAGSENYSSASVSSSRNTEPLTQATAPVFSAITETGMTLTWANGDGDRRLVIIRSGSAVSTDPTDLTPYTASPNFNAGAPSGTAIGSGNVVFDGTGTSVAITNLFPGVTYHFAVYEYNAFSSGSVGTSAQAAYLTPGLAASQATSADATPPALLTTGVVTPNGGRTVTLSGTQIYFNNTNTGINVVVPLTNTDGSLDGGNVRIQVQNTTTNTFVNVPNSGLSTITAGQRGAGSKTMVLAIADLTAGIGFIEGLQPNAFAAETQFIEFRAVVTDLAAQSTTYTKSTTQTDVDRVSPNVTTPLALFVSGSLKERILFNVSENLYDFANAVRTDGFGFISADTPYGNPGITVGDPGIGTDDLVEESVTYQSDGGLNSFDNSYTNTRLIEVTSRANGSNWSVTGPPPTQVQYVPGGSGSSSAFVMRDAAGNEMAAFTTGLNTGTTTTLGSAVNSVEAGPNINNSLTNRVVFAFSLTATGALTVSAVSIAVTGNPSGPAGLMKNFRLYSHTADNFGAATNTGLAATVNSGATGSVDFNAASISLAAATTKYFYLVADVEDFYLSLNPTIRFSMTADDLPSATGGITVSTGGVAGTTQPGILYTMKDVTAPTIVSVTNVTDPIYEGALTQEVAVRYSESMNTTTAPVIAITSAANFGAQTAKAGGTNGWFTTTFTNDTYRATFLHNATEETTPGATTSVAMTSTGTDWGGNANSNTVTSAGFLIDNAKPTISSITTNISQVTIAANVIRVTVQYNKSMKTSSAPSFTFAPANANFGAGVPVSGGGYTNGWKMTAFANDTYEIDFTHNLTQEFSASTTVSANGAFDAIGASGNVQTVATASTGFLIDTQRPFAVSINRAGPQFTTGPTVTYVVTFNEVTSGVDEADFTPFKINGTVPANGGTVVIGGITTADQITYNVDVTNLTGDGDVRLDINGATATILDARSNALNANKTGDEFYSIDNTAPTVQSISIVGPTNSWSTTNGTSAASIQFNVTFNEPVQNISINNLSPFSTGDVNVGNGSVPPNTTGNTVVVTGTTITGTGQFRINFVDDDVPTDQAGNPVGGVGPGNGDFATTFTTNQYYTIVLPEPTASATVFTQSTTTTSVTVGWDDAVLPVQQATDYLVRLKKSTSTFTPVTFVNATNDGADYTDNDFTDGVLAMYVPYESVLSTGTTTFSGLSSGTVYNIEVYPLTRTANYGSDNWDYLFAGVLTGNATTGVANNTTVAFTSSSPLIPSTVTAGPGQAVFTFQVNEDGTSPITKAADNAPFKFSNFIISQGTTNGVVNWTTAISAATLTRGVTTIAGTVNPTNLSFVIPNFLAPGDFGYILDDASQQYTLNIVLNTSLGVPDNSIMDFRVNNASFTLNNTNQSSSLLAAGQLAQSGNVRIDVTATKLRIITNTPGAPPQIGVQTNFPVPPSFEATDVNNARDLDYNNGFTANTVVPFTTTHTNFASGLLTLSNFRFTAPGATTIQIVGNLAPAVTPVTTTSVTAVISNLTQITAGGAIEPGTFSSLTTALTGATLPQLNAGINFDFTVTDDVGANGVNFSDNDGLPTILNQITITAGAGNDAILNNWTQAIAGAELSDGTSSVTIAPGPNITASSLIFNITGGSSMNIITDGGNNTYRLKIWLQNPVNALLQDVIDNKDFVFNVANTSIVTGATPTSSTLQVSAQNSGNGNNTVAVTATRLVFTTQPNASQNYDAAIAPSPVLKTQDVNGNKDIDYAALATVTTITPLTYTIANTVLTTTTGLITFDPAFRVTSAGGGLNGGTTNLVVSSGALTSATSNLITLNYSGNSDIIQNTGFAYPPNIPYIAANNQVADITAGTGVAVEQFTVRDGGLAANDPDGTATKLSSITIRITNYQYLRRLAIYNVNTGLEVGDKDVVPLNLTNIVGNQADITFSGITTFQANDNGTNNLEVKVSFNAANVTDKQVITFQVTNVVAGGVSSSFANPNPVGIASTAAAPQNAIQVIATQIDFTTVPATASINVSFTVVAESRDANANRDTDYNGAISFTGQGNTSGYTVTNSPAGPFISGVLNYPLDNPITPGVDEGYQFLDGTTFTRLTINGAANAQSGAITGTSPAPGIDVKSSTDAYVYFDDTGYIPLINSATQQSASMPATANATIATLAKLVLSDGGAATFEATGTNVATSDADGAFTRISQISFSVTNFADLRTLALYDNAGNKISSDVGTGASVNFTGLNIQAPDNGTAVFTVRTTFAATIGADHDVVQLQVTGVTQSAGSLLYQGLIPPNAAYKGGVLNGDITPISANRIDVVATKLVFTQNPPAFAGINEPVPYSGIPATMLEARDANDNLDTDFDQTLFGTKGDVTSPALTTTSYFFNGGVLNLGSIQYSNIGNGTLTVSVPASNGLPYIVEGVPGPVIASPSNGVSSAVEVIHTTAAYAGGGLIPGPTANIAGGAVDRKIFGITFTGPLSQPSGHPDLSRFVIAFGLTNPLVDITTIIQNWRIYENSTGTFGGPNITTLTGTITPINYLGSSVPQALEVVFATPRDLSTAKSYFLQIDVDPTASGSTSNIQPQVVDLDYTHQTEGNVVTTQGSVFSNVAGNVYSFSAIFPPSLEGSYPAKGQLNVSNNQPKISLNFSVPVWTLDEVVYLIDLTLGDTLVLTADNARYSLSAGGTIDNKANPVIFSIPAGIPTRLRDDHVYYLSVKPGRFDGPTNPNLKNAGFMDEAGNLFSGINFSGTLFFKVANPNPPNLLSTPTSPANPSATGTLIGGLVSATFDQAGTAHYLILPNGTLTPTPDQVRGIGLPHPFTVAKGTININQVNPISQFGTFVPLVGLSAGTPYDVWMSTTSTSEFSATGLKVNAVISQVPATSPAHFGSIAKVAKTGNIITSTTSSGVNGVGTLFDTELRPGRTLYDGSGTTVIGVIASIQGPDTLTLATVAQLAIPGPAGGSYMASGFEVGATGPTLTFTPSANPGGVTLNNPSLTICTNAFQVLNQPIMISESGAGNDFNGAGTQTFNLVLPAGFEFDVAMSGPTPVYGTLNLIGTDFVGSGQLSFIGSAILKVSYQNSGSGSVDRIIISGLSVRANSSTSGSILRFGGNALLPGGIPDLSAVGSISSSNSTGIAFYNSYSTQTFNNTAVTTIPNNFDDPNITQQLVAELVPSPPYGDFGPSTFSGPGVSVNLLSLTAVSLGVPFNVTINHTDNNGCPSTAQEQYTVYDSETAIADLSTEYSSVNNHFTISTPQNTATPGLTLTPTPNNTGNYDHLHTITFNRLQSYYLDSLVADVPTYATDQILNSLPGNTPRTTDQLIFGPAWKALLNNNLLIKDTHPGPTFNGFLIGTGGGYTPGNNPKPGPPPHEYYDYHFDEATILNAKAIDPAIPLRPYDFFAATTTQGNTYYRGGSLGIVQFTGYFQSIANASVRIPLIQNVRFFVPAVPIIETSAPSYLDIVDPANLPGAGNPGSLAVVGPGGSRSSNKGTPVFCQLGLDVTVNGFPAAAPGSSIGWFTVTDNADTTIVLFNSAPAGFGTAVPNAGFTDNTNGTASLKPNLPAIQNGYRHIRIYYSYQENNSPSLSTTYQIIRISPNPVATFTAASTPDLFHVVSLASRCVGEPITFKSGATSSDPVNKTMRQFDWNFGDPTSSFNVSGGPAPTDSVKNHTYANPSLLVAYTVTHSTVSFYGCPSVTPAALTTVGAFTAPIDVGGIPDVKYSVVGLAKGDVFTFVSTDPALTTVNSNPVTDRINKYVWDFGQGTVGTNTNTRDAADGLTTNAQFNADAVNFTYTQVGPQLIDLSVETVLGCRNSLGQQGTYRSIVVLDRFVFTSPTDVYSANFDGTPANWQPWGTGATIPDMLTGIASLSWGHGTPANPFKAGFTNGYLPILDDDQTGPPPPGAWKTNPSGTYNVNEKSALYSLSFDLAALQRPMVSFNSIVKMSTSDGVVLQYSTDNLNIADPKKVWLTLGGIGEGQDWFNVNAIAGKPGQQSQDDFGWSAANDSLWIEPKHTLDVVGGSSSAVFRFALGAASGTTPQEGFWMDNFRIGDRTRTILLENFWNLSQSNQLAENTFVAGFQNGAVGTEVVKLNYHVNFPGKDPFNEDNPADPSSRALFYNITQTPASVLDGYSALRNTPFSGWGQAEYDRRTLDLAQADINIVPTVNTDGTVSIDLDVTAKATLGIPANTLVHLAVMEMAVPIASLPTNKANMVAAGVTTAEFVVKKMLPSAAGTQLSTVTVGGADLAKDATVSFPTMTFMPDASKLYDDPDDIAIAVFLQESMPPYEVYQVELFSPIADPPAITGLEPLAAEQVKVFPNPAHRDMTVELPAPLGKPAALTMIDQTGRPVLRSTMATGTDRQTINVSDLSSGVYILTVDMGSGTLTRKKVIVVHQD